MQHQSYLATKTVDLSFGMSTLVIAKHPSMATRRQYIALPFRQQLEFLPLAHKIQPWLSGI